MALPKFIALELTTNQKYLYYVAEKDTEGNKGLLRFSGELVTSPYSKFEKEMAESDTNQGLVHIRCCYNNKYWVNSRHPNKVAALAKQRNEDLSDESCTLFKPEISSHDDKTVVRFVHASTNIYLSTDSEFRLIMGDEKNDKIVGDKEKDGSSFSVVDWHASLVLPQYVAFKGENGRYLSSKSIESSVYLQFSESEIGDETVGKKIFYNKDGSIRIKSIGDGYGKFWRLTSNYILADEDDNSGNDPDTWFSVVKVNDKTIALRNLGNHQFCRSLSDYWKRDCLHASVNTINRSAQLEVEEPVISREIMEVRFRINDARIYGQFPIVLASGEVTNWNGNDDQYESVLSYTLTESSTWNNSVSLKLGTEATIQTGVPFIVDGEVKISSEFSGAYSWGEKKESSCKLQNRWTGKVPKYTRVTVSLLATKGTCDVPFSYTQVDTLRTGKRVTYRKDDGLYTGINFFNIDCETKEKPMYYWT